MMSDHLLALIKISLCPQENNKVQHERSKKVYQKMFG